MTEHVQLQEITLEIAKMSQLHGEMFWIAGNEHISLHRQNIYTAPISTPPATGP